MAKTTSKLIQSAVNQASSVYRATDNLVKKGANLTWPDIARTIDTMRQAKIDIEELIAESSNSSRSISKKINEELGLDVNIIQIFQDSFAEGLEFTAEALVIFNNNNTRETLEENGNTIFREVTFTSPTIDPLIAKAIEIRTLVQDFSN